MSATRRIMGRSLRLGLVMLLVSAAAAHANVGIPMLAYAWPAGWVLLIPVIAVEALVARRVLRTSWRSSVKVAGLGNFVSTLAGIPLAWIAALAVSTVVYSLSKALLPGTVRYWVTLPFYAPWLPPIGDEQAWVVPAAGVLLCVPFLLASVWIERRVAQRVVDREPADLRRWAWRANLLSYSLIAAGLTIVALVIGRR